MRTVAALYIDPRGPYPALLGRESCWDEARDARLYAGPHPVVAHPPCDRWGRYWSGGPNPRARRRKLGDDGGCFAAALAAVRAYGGVLEHPEASHAFAFHGLPNPPKAGGWIGALGGGWVCCVEQGHYGHPARKATWLYTTAPNPPELMWGPSTGQRLDEGFHSREERIAARAAGVAPRKRLSTLQNLATPVPFAELLIAMARAAAVERAA